MSNTFENELDLLEKKLQQMKLEMVNISFMLKLVLDNQKLMLEYLEAIAGEM